MASATAPASRSLATNSCRLAWRARTTAARELTLMRQSCPKARRALICTAGVGLFYSTSTGHTEDVASLIKQEIGDACSEPKDIGDVKLETLANYDGLIVGAPTWNTGADTERSGTAWDSLLDDIRGLQLNGTPVAVFGLGDSVSYGDNFAGQALSFLPCSCPSNANNCRHEFEEKKGESIDSMEEIYEVFKAAGGKLIGHWPTEGYQHTESKAQIDDNTFCGLPLDEDNEDDKSLERIKGWLQTIKDDMQF